jgi:hypothetical protein
MGAQQIINTHDQLTAAQGGIAIVRHPARSVMPRRWVVYRVDARGVEVMTDTSPDCAWYNYNRKTFIYRGRDDVIERRLDAQDWIAANLGEPGPWTRNRMGDYVPVRINQSHPIAKREKAPATKPEMRDGANR